MRRDQVASGDVLYTCNCGFVDMGHATPTGPAELWRKVRDEIHEADHRLNNNHTIEGHAAFVIGYYQGQGVKWFKVLAGHHYLIRRSLPEQRKKQVALAIFMEVSKTFEQMQADSWFERPRMSGFSIEDLMSNLIGFHVAVNGLKKDDAVRACGPVSVAASLAIFDKHIKGREAELKVHEFLQPQYFPCNDCRGQPRLPQVLSSLQPAGQNGDFIRLPTSLPFDHWFWGNAVDFDRFGRPQGQARAHTAPAARPTVRGRR